MWYFQVPKSRCSGPCMPGSRKMVGSSVHKCCYDCVECPEGEVSSKDGRVYIFNTLITKHEWFFLNLLTNLYLEIILHTYTPNKRNNSNCINTVDVQNIRKVFKARHILHTLICYFLTPNLVNLIISLTVLQTKTLRNWWKRKKKREKQSI